MNEITKIAGYIDEFGLMCLKTNIINPDNRLFTGKIKAVVDTGAASSHLKQNLIDHLQLKPNGINRFSHPISGSIESESFSVLMSLQDGFNLVQATVLTLYHESYPAGLILGMNILKDFDIHYFSKEHRFELIHQI